MDQRRRADTLAAGAAQGAATGAAQGPLRRLETPLYHQVYLVLRQAIAEGRFADGAALPTEQALCRRFGVSRVTVQRAMERLVAEGLVVRRRGSGSRLAEGAAARLAAGGLRGLLDQVAAVGASTQRKILSIDYLPPPPAIARSLKLAPGVAAQHALQLRSHGGLALGIIDTWVPEDIARRFTDGDMLNTPMLMLVERAGVRVARAEQSIGATAADDFAARHLEVAPGAPLVRLERLIEDEGGRPVEHLTALYRADRYRYRMDMTRAELVGRIWSALG